MTTAAKPLPPHHNTLTCYINYDCRLPECVERYNANERDRRKKKRQGTYERYTDASVVRTHVQQLLAAGASPRGIADRAGVADRTVRDLLPTRADGSRAPLKYRVLTTNAEKLLALTPEDVIPQFLPGTGTIRRLQANVADGWPMIHLAQQVGVYPTYISSLIMRANTLENLQVRGTTALAVARAYDELRGKQPRQHGASNRGVRYARQIGKDRRWPPTSYWDERPGSIDDPDFEPMYGVTRREIVAQDAGELMRISGLDKLAAAERLGVSKSYIEHAFRDHPQYAVAVAA
ncbi:hypothetical protein [Streptomyces sp. NPDC003720]|uniref:hypothetical protein n=1 Tax=Streptomyces sp. NPDC003720 TaxID=3364684 RepID=UPI00368A2DB4